MSALRQAIAEKFARPSKWPPGESLTILVVEDDADTRANMVDILEMNSYSVDSVGTAAAALANLALADYAVILLDRRLPDTTAEALLPKIREAAPNASVIIVTGFADVTGIVEAMREGAVDYIFKPVNIDLLRSSIERVADRRWLHLAMRRSEAARQVLIDAVPGIVLSLRHDGTIAYFNDFASQVTGYAEAEVIGKRFSILKPEIASSSNSPRRDYDPLADRRLRSVEALIRRSDDTARWTSWNWAALEDVDGQPLLLGVAQDITERKNAEQRALQNERLAAIGQTMAGLVHESRNALQRAKACLEMLTHEVRDRPPALQLLARVQRAQDDLQRLFEEVRGYAAPLRLDLQPCDITVVWRDAWEQLASRHGPVKLALIERFEPADAVCNIDRFALGQVFRNIFENAIDVSPASGEINVEMTSDTLDNKDAVRISIRDQGPGFDEEHKQRVFEPFFTTKTKGTGLGMAICQRIVEAHGGQISVGAQGTGAEIVFRVPRGKP